MRVSPGRVMVAAGGRARLRLEGTGYGVVRAGRSTRWVWGAFDHTVVVPTSTAGIEVELLGIGGRVRRRVECAHVIDVQSPPLKSFLPTLRTTVRAPQLRRLRFRRFSAPRIVRLQSPSTETTP